MTPDRLPPDRLTMTVPQTARALGISETLAYQQSRKNGWLVPAVIKIGNRTLISRSRLQDLVDRGSPSIEYRGDAA